MKKDRLFSYFASAIILAEIVLIILSWLITAAYPELSMRSILSGEGVRWLLGHFVDNQMSPVMVWM
ncbi:MAG: ABC transporter substrate-binding protein, partial [Prevotella sp.]